jgi:hypothetical protein
MFKIKRSERLEWIGMDWNGVVVAAEVAKTDGTLKRLVFHESLPRMTFLSCTKTDCQTQNPRTVEIRSVTRLRTWLSKSESSKGRDEEEPK